MYYIAGKPQIKFYLACNQLPTVPSIDGGTWRRLRVTNFGSKFVERPQKPNEHLIDASLKDKIKDWAPLFVSYLIHLYVTEYKKIPYLSEPDAVKISTESYKMENDHFTEYFINRVVYTGDKKDTISMKAIYEDFKAWFKSSHEGVKVSNQVDLNKFLFEKIGDPKKTRWRGYKFNGEEEEPLSDDDEDIKNALDI
jgi:phage/plasmid-associated DNA primase